MYVQLLIDFTVPFDLSATQAEIDYTILNFGLIDVPFVEVKPKKRKRK